jgi:hypothetical protein
VALDIVRRPKATQHRSMSWSGTCAAASARRCAAIRTNAAIWWRCERRRFRPVIRRQRGGRENDNAKSGMAQNDSTSDYRLTSRPDQEAFLRVFCMER